MDSYRGLTDKELMEKLKRLPENAAMGPPRKLYERKVFQLERERRRRGGGDNIDLDQPPLEWEGATSSWETEDFEAPSLHLEPRQPLRPLPKFGTPPSGQDHPPGRMLPLGPQLLLLGILGVSLLLLLYLGGVRQRTTPDP